MKKVLCIICFSILLVGCDSDNSVKSLGDKWTLYRGQFMVSETIKPTEYLTEEYQSGDSYYGYGTLTQKISVTPGKSYSLYISGILSSSRIFVNDKLLGTYGVVDSSIEKCKPEIKRAVLNFTPTESEVTVYIEFTNFHFMNSALFKWIVYGESIDIIRLFIRNQSKDYLTFGLLAICSILFLIMFLVDRKNTYNIYFALFALSYALRSYLMKNTTVESFFPEFHWILHFQFNKASELWALVFILLFLLSLFPKEFSNVVSRSIVVGVSITSLLSFLPLEVFNELHILTVMQVEIIIAGLYIIIRLITAVKNRSTLAKSSLFSIVLFFISIVLDIVINRYIVTYDYLSAQFVVIVVGVMFLQIGRTRFETGQKLLKEEVWNSELRESFSRFVPMEILNNLGNNEFTDNTLGESNIMILTVAYIDIRNFTELSQTISPTETFNLLNKFYDIVGGHVNKNNGYIESFGGDGVKVLFPDSPQNAIDTIREISNDVKSLEGIRTGMSIHFGKVILGIIGSDERIQATAISEVTRIVSKMDQFNAKVGIEMLITGQVYGLTEIDNNNILYLGNITLKEETDPMDLYQILPEGLDMGDKFKDTFSRGVAYIRSKSYQKAYSAFQIAEKLKPTHQLTRLYIEELENFFRSGDVNFSLKL